MMQFGLIGVGAGAAAALLFASVTSGTWLSIPLFYLAPLPILIAGIGWSHWAGMIAALAGGTALGLAFGGLFFLAFLMGVGLPGWWLGYLAMLARPAAASAGPAPAAPPALEWYPVGRLTIWAALLAAVMVLAAIPNFGLDAESFRAGLRAALATMLRVSAEKDAPVPGMSDSKAVVDVLVEIVPPAAAGLATITHLANLWIAGRVVRFSGRLTRPWPMLPAMTFPRQAAALFAAAVALSFAGGLLGIAAGVVAAALAIAYGALGLAVLHDITRGLRNRPLLLGTVYAALIILRWPLVFLCLLGLADAAIGLRDRISRKRGPPAVT